MSEESGAEEFGKLNQTLGQYRKKKVLLRASYREK